MKPIFKRLLSGVLSATMTVSAIPIVSAHAEESTEPYPYTMFAASSDDGAITVNAGNFCVNGNVATNGTIVSSGNTNINGTKTEDAGESMIFIFDKIDTQYFSVPNVEEHEEDYTLDELNININVPTEVQGDATLTGNININNALKALENINLYGEVKNTNDSVIFSEYGDIIIDSQNVNLNGLVYAPFGTVNITAQNLNLNNVTIIANKISLNCSNVNANNNNFFSSFVGTISEEPEYIHINDNYMIHRFGNEYAIGDGFNGFSGIIAQSDSVEDFTINVYDKNHTQIYTHDIIPNFNWEIENIGMLYGVNYVEFVADYQDGTACSKEITVDCDLFNLSDYISIDMNDDDGDGLVNYLEGYFGTDKDNPDTDGDGLTDNDETALLSTNPLAVDSDDNGVSDADEDFDHDTLTNIQELEIGSSPIDVDSDDDKLLDKEELAFGTSLIDPDTDHDGISDYDEVKLGLSPLTPDDVNGKITTSFCADEIIPDYDPAVIPTIEITGDFECISSFKMATYDNNQIISPNVPGYVGKAYSFTTDKAFESAKVSFALDMDQIEISDEFEFEPVLYWLNEETQMLEEVQGQTRNGNTIEANLTHFSTYVVVNRAEFLSRWFTNFSVSEDEFYSGELTEKKSKKDVLFLIDQSGSMRTSDTNNIKTHILDDFVSAISNRDRISVVGFNHEKIGYSDFESEKTKIFAALDALEKAGNSGGTNIGLALQETYDEFENKPEDTYQAIFLISDGDSSDSPSDKLLDNYKSKGVRIFTVGIGSLSTKAKNELDRIAKKTDGQFYGVKQSSKLGDTLIEFEKEISVDKDKNKDGIEDYYEYLMGTGELTTTTNKTIFEGLYDELITRGKDFDDDGLDNCEEIEIVFFNNVPKVKVITNPIFNDTDGDDYLDGEEKTMGTDPLTKEDIIINADYLKIGESMAAGVASDDYINSNGFLMLGERFIDVYICGGKFDYIRMIQSSMIDYISYYGEMTYGIETFDGHGNPSETSVMSSAIGEMQQFIDLGRYSKHISANDVKKAKEAIDYINKTRKELNAFRNTKAYKNGVRSARQFYKQWAKDYHKIGRQIGNFEKTVENGAKANNVSKGVGAAACVLYCATYAIDDILDGVTLYANSCNGERFTELFRMLSDSSDPDVANAAQNIAAGLEDGWEIFFNTIKDCGYDVVRAFGVFKAHSALCDLGPIGIVIEIALIGTSLIVGDACSVRVTNSINVGITQDIDQAISRKFMDGHRGYNSDGEMIVALTVEEEKDFTNLFIFNTFAKCYAEREYLRYLNQDRWLIYKTSSSKSEATRNITELNDIICKYCNCEIPIDKQISVS